MTTVEARVSSQPKRTTPSAQGKSATAKSGKTPPSVPTGKTADASDHVHTTRVTKHDRVLTILSRREGATIPELMEATGWQQHSVRGFLAGTVKKKLGFTLTSSKTAGELRRYRIGTKRGR
jgi:hypothetical protein